jgi:ribosome-associated protein
MEAQGLRITRGLSIPFDELKISSGRSSGPGGQHANKTETRITLKWDIAASKVLSAPQRARLLRKLASILTSRGELTISVEDFRSQHRNKTLAYERLVNRLQNALRREKRRIKTKPSKTAKTKRVEAKKKVSAKKRLRRKDNLGD